MDVVESSRAVDLLCPGSKDGTLRGYRNQSLFFLVHQDDRGVVDRLQSEAQQRCLAQGSTFRCRVLRTCFDEGCGVQLARWTPLELRLAHASPDGAFLLVSFDERPGLLGRIEAGPRFWERFYAPAHGVQQAACHLYNKSDGMEAVEYFPPAPLSAKAEQAPSIIPLGVMAVQAEGTSSRDRGRKGGGLPSIPLQSLPLSVRDFCLSVVMSKMGFWCRCARDRVGSVVPRLLLVAAAPAQDLKSLSLSSASGQVSFMVPFGCLRADGEACPITLHLVSDTPCMGLLVAVDVGEVEEDKGGPMDSFRFLLINFTPGDRAVVMKSCFDIDRSGAKFLVDNGALGRASARYLRDGDPSIELLRSFDLYENSPVHFTDRILFSDGFPF